MFIQKTFSFKGLMSFAGHHFIWLTLWMSTPVLIFYFFDFKYIFIPWLPVSIMGTAVAFYVGFKNNQSYDRLWEARKIWGAIVNSSRAWGSTVKGFVSDNFGTEKSEKELSSIITKLIHAHIAWLYQLRKQLLVPVPWEHVALNNKIMRRYSEKRIKEFGLGLVADQEIDLMLKDCMEDQICHKIKNASNSATAIIDLQSTALKALKKEHVIDDFRHMELQKILNDFYVHQGKCERIKKFPFPRQYANMSVIFIAIFMVLLPLGTVMEYAKLGPWGIWASIFTNVIIGWVFVVMELVGDYSENPFEGMGNDIPMLSICRGIEIDLREMLDEKDIPQPIKAVNNVLM